MKHLMLALAAAAALTASAARADRDDFRGQISFGNPGYYAPGYGDGDGYSAGGYWRNVTVRVWEPPHWDVRHDYWGREVRAWEPGHYELRTQRVWVNADRRDGDRDRWNHERWEHEEHERREHGDWRDRDDRRGWGDRRWNR